MVLNTDEDQIGDDAIIDEIAADFADCGFEWIAISAQIEEEISLLDDETREEFLADLGIEQPALDRLTLLCYKTLGLISFFTVINDEVHAWTIPRGSLAPQAGGAVHGDIERGFIRAEVTRYEDLIALGDEQKVKAAGSSWSKEKTQRSLMAMSYTSCSKFEIGPVIFFTRKAFLHIILRSTNTPTGDRMMAAKISEIFTEYEEANKDLEPTTSRLDTEQDIPVEKYCCLTGEAVKSSFCRYPDEKEGTMMVLSKEQMLLHSRNGGNISQIFKQVLALRRKREQ